MNAFAPLYNAKLIDSRELMRVVHHSAALRVYIPLRFRAAQSLVLAGKVAPEAPALTGEGFKPINTRNVAGRNAPIDANQEGGNGG